jgi:hypothetical protein
VANEAAPTLTVVLARPCAAGVRVIKRVRATMAVGAILGSRAARLRGSKGRVAVWWKDAAEAPISP